MREWEKPWETIGFWNVYHWISLVSGFHAVLVGWTMDGPWTGRPPDDVLRNGATILSTSGQVHVPVAIAIETLLAMGSNMINDPTVGWAKLSVLGIWCDMSLAVMWNAQPENPDRIFWFQEASKW